MNNIKHTLWEGITNLSGKIRGPMKESKFYTEGKLTPEEYILAGEFLTQKCPTWKWCEASEGHYDKRLPKDKQYLKTTVACNKRAQDYMKLNATTEKEVEGDWIEADLVKTDESGNVVKCENKVLDLDDDDEKKEKKKEEKKEEKVEDENEDDEDDDDDGDEIIIKNKPKKETKPEVKEDDKKKNRKEKK
jgi:ubiquitin-like-conjugating enzyme ATG3